MRGHWQVKTVALYPYSGMCGRYALTTSPQVLASLLAIHQLRSNLLPRYNIAPTQLVPAIRNDAAGERELVDLHWGLIPSWAKERSIASRMINARSETAAEKPAFRHAFKRRRCVIPADGFYEWKKLGKRKQPFFIHRADGTPMLLAGLWEKWVDPGTGELIESCTILTTEPNEMLAELHNRMPAVLDASSSEQWLDDSQEDAEQLKGLLRPGPQAWFAMHPVSSRVSSPANEGPELIDPVPEERSASDAKDASSPGLFD